MWVHRGLIQAYQEDSSAESSLMRAVNIARAQEMDVWESSALAMRDLIDEPAKMLEHYRREGSSKRGRPKKAR